MFKSCPKKEHNELGPAFQHRLWRKKEDRTNQRKIDRPDKKQKERKKKKVTRNRRNQKATNTKNTHFPRG